MKKSNKNIEINITDIGMRLEKTDEILPSDVIVAIGGLCTLLVDNGIPEDFIIENVKLAISGNLMSCDHDGTEGFNEAEKIYKESLKDQ